MIEDSLSTVSSILTSQFRPNEGGSPNSKHLSGAAAGDGLQSAQQSQNTAGAHGMRIRWLTDGGVHAQEGDTLRQHKVAPLRSTSISVQDSALKGVEEGDTVDITQ